MNKNKNYFDIKTKKLFYFLTNFTKNKKFNFKYIFIHFGI